MNIKLAMLGYLNWKSFSGYDLKKLFAESTFFYWSGNNNQIYKTLVQMEQEGLVQSREIEQALYPTRKEYSITPAGRRTLKEGVNAAPQLPQIRNPFLIQIAWADILADEELFELLNRYEYELDMQLVMFAEKEKRGVQRPGRSRRESLLWDMVAKNWIESYERELAWVRELRHRLGKLRETVPSVGGIQ